VEARAVDTCRWRSSSNVSAGLREACEGGGHARPAGLREACEGGGHARPVPVLDRHSMITATAAPDAPPALVAATQAVRRVIGGVDPDKDLSEDAIVHRFAGRVSQEKATPLVAVAGLTHLEGAIAQAEDELRMIWATWDDEDARDATPLPLTGRLELYKQSAAPQPCRTGAFRAKRQRMGGCVPLLLLVRCNSEPRSVVGSCNPAYALKSDRSIENDRRPVSPGLSPGLRGEPES
jgi:hypothetical protein